MKAFGGVDVYIPVFLIAAPAGGDLPASQPWQFNPREIIFHSSHWMGCWVCLTAGLYDDKRKKSFPRWDSDISVVQAVEPIAVQPALSRFTNPR